MRASFLLPIAATAVDCLVFLRQDACAVDACQQAIQSVSTASFDCAAFMHPTTTLTSGYTYVTGINSEVTYSTSFVTEYALSAPPTVAAERRQASSVDTCTEQATTITASSASTPPVPSYAAACSNAPAYESACGCAFSMSAATKTVKVFTATATATSTITFSEVAQATQTVVACDPNSNYGYFQGSIVWNSEFDGGDVGFHVGQPHQLIYSDSTKEGCCMQCYQMEDAGCLQYEWTPGNNTCALMVNDGSCPQTPEDQLQVILYPNDQKPLVGVGPCDVEVQGFSG